MSVIDLSAVKGDLRVVHDSDDPLLQTLLDASEDEAAQFLGVGGLETFVVDGGELPKSISAAVFLLVRAKYDETAPDAIQKIRACAETLLMPYRVNLGV